MQAPNWTDFLHCSICTSQYNTTTAVPVSLSCTHSMCKRCLSRLQTKQCPYDKSPIPSNLDKFPPNTAFLLLLGYQPESWGHEMSYVFPTIVQEAELEDYSSCREALEGLAVFLKPFTDQGFLHATANIPRPILKKLTGLLSNQILDGEGRMKAVRGAQSIAERIITELLIMHQNQHQISTALWSAVRCRGCQFLGPVMQEEALKLILKALENRRFLSRKTIVMYVVQQLQPDFQNASKTNIGHVVQLLYRASCFNVDKRPNDSSLMQLKEEYSTYEALRREHDAQIIKIAMEAGLRISPETWSTQLYGTTNKKSEMQSIIDKLVSLGVGSSGISELIVAIGRSRDQYNLNERLVSHLDALLQIENPGGGERDEVDPNSITTCSWETCTKALKELLISLQVFTDFTLHLTKDSPEAIGHGQVKTGRFKTGMCPYLVKPGGCPRGALCPYAHSEDERKKYVNMAKPKSRAKPRPDVPHGGSPQLRSTVGKTDVGTGSLPVRQYSSDINEGSFPGFETSASFPGSSTSLYPSNPPPPLSHSEMQQQQPETSYFVRPGPTSMSHTGFFQDDMVQGGGGAYGHHSHLPPPSQQRGYHGFDMGDVGNTGTGYDSTRPVMPYHQQSGKPGIDPQTRQYSTTSSSYPTDFNPGRAGSYSSSEPSERSTPMASSGYYSQDISGEDIATTISASAWKYNRAESSPSNSQRSSLSDEEGVSGQGIHTPVAVGNSGDESELTTSSMTRVPRGGVVTSIAPPINPNPSSSTDHKMVEELTAKVKQLQMKLEEKENAEKNKERVLPHPQAPPSLPFYSSPQNTGLIPARPVVGGVMGRPIHFSGPQQFIPVNPPAPYYDPFTGGLPSQVWCQPMPVAVSPQTTPPNTGLIMHHHPHPPPPPMAHPPQPHQPPPHLAPAMDPSMQYQLQSDESLAHFINFQEQAKARPLQVAPGAHLPPHHPPSIPSAHPPIPQQLYFDYYPVMAAQHF